jgi:predicted GNAT family acetyltransferase
MSTEAPTGQDVLAHIDEPSTDAQFEIAVARMQDRHQYLATESEVEIAAVQFEEIDGRVVLLTTTVAPAFRGRGIADELIAYTLDDLQARGARVTVLCPVVRAFLAQHPEYQGLLDPLRPDF